MGRNDTMQREDDAPTDQRHALEPQWLTPCEKRAWLGFQGAYRLVDEAIERDLQERHGVSHGDYLILAMLAAVPDYRVRMSALAELVYVSRSRLTYQVTR